MAVVDLVALSLLPLWRRRFVADALKAGRAAGEILEEHAAARARQAAEAAGAPTLRARAAIALDRAHTSGIDLIAWTDPRYPALLGAIVDPPPVLWVRGCPGALDRPAVAIVGSRAGSPYSLAVAERLACDLAARELTVISGMARGVDGAAHRGALAAGGATLAVLGSGVDVVYPREHRPLAEEIAVRGALVSELVPGTPPRAPFFPLRNRIISGLSRGVVIVEAGEKSGSLITARCALEQGRDVLSVPGNVLSGRNRGGHALLRDGARLVETVDDILEELGIAQSGARPVVTKATDQSADRLNRSATGDALLGCLLPGEACDVDTLAERSGLVPSRLLVRLCDLELRGLVRRAGGGRFVRADGSC